MIMGILSSLYTLLYTWSLYCLLVCGPLTQLCKRALTGPKSWAGFPPIKEEARIVATGKCLLKVCA